MSARPSGKDTSGGLVAAASVLLLALPRRRRPLDSGWGIGATEARKAALDEELLVVGPGPVPLLLLLPGIE